MDKKWLETCATAGEFLYGQYTISALKKMYESKPGYSISISEMVAEMKDLEKSGAIMMSYVEGLLDERDKGPGFFLPVECEGTALEAIMRQADMDGNPYASLHFDEDERLELVTDCPDDIEFYTPTAAEIEQLMTEGYIRTPAMTRLEEQISRRGGEPEFLKDIWSQISTGKLEMMEAVNAIFSGIFPEPDEENNAKEGTAVKPEMNSHLPTMEDLNALMPYINEFLNNINNRGRRGWRPGDLFRKQYPYGMTKMPTIMPGSANFARMLKEIEPRLREMGADVDYSSIHSFNTVGPFGEKRVVKIGRNDPCPCGSGKKYKRCHGR